MNFFDLFLTSILLIFGYLGFKRGILRTILSIIGLFTGGLAGIYLVPYVQNIISEFTFGFKPFLGFFLISAFASLGMFLFGLLGSFLRIVLLPFPFMKIIDSFIGLILSLVAVATVSLTVANTARIIPNKTINNLITNSQIIYFLNENTPTVLKINIERFQNVIMGTNITDVFTSLVSSRINTDQIDKDVTIPQSVKNSISSVVRIDGIANSCSAAMTGTGFIVANEKVITNAHVIAGVDEPVVTLTSSNLQLQGKVVGIDREKDLALIYVPGLPGEKLMFIGPTQPNEIGFIVGFPNGGNLKTSPVLITSEFQSIGANIDGVGEVKREVIVFGGPVWPGDSGGPLLNSAGQVLGVVFAADAQSENTGYALAPNEVISFVSSISDLNQEIETGMCAKSSN